MVSVQETLDRLTEPAQLSEPLGEGRVRCLACAHRCRIASGHRGICQVRSNRSGQLYAPWGYVAGLAIDPIEKKPFYHVLPGSPTLTFGMLGCNFKCPFCQNWFTSQTLKDPCAEGSLQEITLRDLIDQAVAANVCAVMSSYNEPLITAEWAAAIFKAAKARGMLTGFVSNGYATPEALDFLRPCTDLFKVDLKTFRDASYRQLGGVLQHVLDAIVAIYKRGFWIEIVTLLIPGFNDSDEEVREMARFVKSVSPDIPWHVTGFQPEYHWSDRSPTEGSALIHAAEIGYAEGLHFVYAGNRPGSVQGYEDTRCPACSRLLVRREGFKAVKNLLEPGFCPSCSRKIPGVWRSKPYDERK